MLIIDSSQAKAYAQCPAKYQYNYIDQLRRIGYEDDLDLRFGEAIHYALEAFTEKTTDYQIVLDRFTEKFEEKPFDCENDRYMCKNPRTGLEILKQFKSFYENNFSGWETLQVEETGHIMLGDDIKYLCKIDRVVKSNGNIYPLDFKTCAAKWTDNYFNRFKLDFQASGYTQWTKEKYGQCSGFIPLIMFMEYRSEYKKDGKSNMKIECEYSEKALEVVKQEWTITKVQYSKYYKKEMIYSAGFHCRFDYNIVNRTREQLADFRKDILKINEEISINKRDGFFRKSPTACEYFGCQYSELCDNCGDEALKSSLYEWYDATEYLNREG